MSRLFRAQAVPGEVLAIDPRALTAQWSWPGPEPVTVDKGIAVVRITGPMEHHKSPFFDSYDGILERVSEAFQDEDAKAVVMRFDSPGGDAAGATETHHVLRRLSKKYGKPLLAYADEAAFSAAYELASGCDEIWLPSTGGVGSVGVIAQVVSTQEQSKKQGIDIRLITSGERKADSHPERPITDEIVERVQEQVDYLANIFWNVVAKSRDMTPQAVAALEAGTFQGKLAVKAGLADGVAGWDKFVSLISAFVGPVLAKPKSAPASGAAINGDPQMKSILALTAKRDAALAAMSSATDSDKKDLLAKFEAAAVALAVAKAERKSERKEEESEEEESEEESEESRKEEGDDEEGDEEEEEESRKEEGDDDDSDDDDSEEEESESEEEEGRCKRKSKATTRKLVAAVKALTGKSDPREMLGALEATQMRLAKVGKMESRVAQLEQSARKTQVASMIAQARKQGKITKAQVKDLTAKGLQDSKFLRGFLANLPKIVRTMDDGYMLAATNEAGAPVLNKDQEKILQAAAASAGVDPAKYAAEMAATVAKKGNGQIKF